MSLTKQELISCLIKYNNIHGRNLNHLKKLKKKQLEKLLIQTHDHLNGGGLFDTIKNVGKEVKERVSGFIKGFREDFPPGIRKFLNLFGNNNIIELKACREEVAGAIETVLNLVSLGEYEKNKKNLAYDQIFHLFLVATTKSKEGVITNIRLEKNEQLGIYKYDKLCSDYIQIPIKDNLTLYNLLENGIRNASIERFFSYSPFSNNCQDWVKLILESNKKYLDITNNIISFVKQNTMGILSGFAKDFGTTVTGLASRFRVLFEGKGKRKKRKR